MEAKQMELFTENDFDPPKTYFRKTNHWVLIDNLDRRNFDATRRIHYKMVVDTIGKKTFNEESTESTPLNDDRRAKILTVSEYFMLASLIREKGLYLYNKKLGKTILKEGKP
jgi:hypothetical protein